MRDKMDKDIRTCVFKDSDNRCVFIHDMFGCYCAKCGFMKSKM